MDKELRILILEDVAAHAELMERELRKAEMVFSTQRAVTQEAFLQALEDFNPDLILADYSLPSFDGLSALSIAREKCPAVPFVFVSGAIGEELAIDTLKQGATDYVLKQRLSRLVPAVRRALREAGERTALKRAEEALRQTLDQLELRYKERMALLEISSAIIANLDRQSFFNALAQSLRKILPFDRTTLTLYDPERDILKVVALEGLMPVQPFGGVGWEINRPGSHFGWVLDHRQYLLRHDLAKELVFSTEEKILTEGIHSYIAVPLMGKGKPLGTLTVASQAANRYSEDDALFLLEVAGQVALAIENVLAYEEIAELKARLEQENIYLREEIKTEYNFEEIVGQGPAIRKVLKAIETVAPTEATVLILGETGTGKELVARAVHNLIPPKDKPLVKVNCAALPATLIESELFGHEKGAFTGALCRKIGRFELANHGTIFLDEIGDLPLDLQAKLLRVLQEGEFERVGGSYTLKINVRVIAATNRDLEIAVQEGKFRVDLYYRLNVFPIRVPALRERTGDIQLLIEHFVSKYSKKMGKKIEAIPQTTIDTLMAYSWPGNVRELENVIERAVIISQGSQLEVGDWLPKPAIAPNRPRIMTLEERERQQILETLQLTGWLVSGEKGAATLLGLRPTTLEARMKKLGIHRKLAQAPSLR